MNKLLLFYTLFKSQIILFKQTDSLLFLLFIDIRLVLGYQYYGWVGGDCTRVIKYSNNLFKCVKGCWYALEKIHNNLRNSMKNIFSHLIYFCSFIANISFSLSN